MANGSYLAKGKEEIRGSGYVVESLEAALWCFHNNDSFASTVLAAANLGDDADTTAAIAGQIAGAYYGCSSIPPGWLKKLYMREKIQDYAERLYEAAGSPVIPLDVVSK